MLDDVEADDNQTSTYNKFKTQNELDLEKAIASGPPEIPLDDLDELIDFGQIVQYIQQGHGMVLIQPKSPLKLYDLDNYVCI